MKKAVLIMVMFLVACTKIAHTPQQVIDLGVVATSTSIKSIKQIDNVVTAEFETTVGAKYSVQIIPFGSKEPVRKEGFTATEVTTKRIYNLSDLVRKDYDLIFIDISGKEAKFPIIIK